MTLLDDTTIAELDDVEEKVYAIGLDVDSLEQQELASLLELLEDAFDEASWIVLNLPIEGSVEVSEIEIEDLREALEYQNLVGDLEDPPFGGSDDG